MKPPRHDSVQNAIDLPASPDTVPVAHEAPSVDDVTVWHPIEEAPHDGTLIEYRAGDATGYTRYRITRRRDFANRSWKVVGFWADVVTREEIAATLDGWRMPDGYLMPGMVV